MKWYAAVSWVAVIALVAAAGGFIGGARFASANNRAMETYSSAMRAGGLAQALTLAERGDRDALARYVDDTLDTSLIGAVLYKSGHLPRDAQDAVRLAANYRAAHPGPNQHTGLTDELKRAVELAK